MANVQDRGPPSAAAIAIGTAIVAGLTGYFIGQASSIGLFGKSDTRAPTAPLSRHEGEAKPDTSETESDDDDAEDDDEDDDVQDLGELQTFPGNSEECKLVLVVRSDLGNWLPYSNIFQNHANRLAGMTKGKIAAQCGHATLACYKTLVRADPSHPVLKRWERLGQAKVALKIDSEDDMLMLQAQAISLGLCAQVIHDAGRTQIASGSATVLGIGPAPKSKIDEVTGHLKLL